MAEWRVAEIVRESDRLRERPVSAEAVRRCPGDLRDLDCMIEPRPKAPETRHAHETLHLRLVLQIAKRLGVDDSIAVDLERGASRMRARGAVRTAVEWWIVWRSERRGNQVCQASTAQAIPAAAAVGRSTRASHSCTYERRIATIAPRQ